MVALGVLALALAATAVGLAVRGGSAEPRPIGLAAASLTEVLPRIAPGGRFSFGGSNQLAQQVRRGAPFDVFFSASPRYAEALHREGLVREPVPFATNDLVLIVPRDGTAGLRNVDDLARRPGLRLVVAGPEVPIGAYTRDVLRRLDLLDVLEQAVSEEPDVKGIVGKVALGEADAGFVYATDVAPVADRVRVIRVPVRAQPTVVYELAVAREPEDDDAARKLVDAVLGADGQRALRAVGFGRP